MKTIRFLVLHLAYGGIEKAVISQANLFAEKYPVEIISVYRMPNSPAYPLDPRIKVRYLLKDVPNRQEWHEALRARRPLALFRESFRALRTLWGKKLAVRRTVRSIHDGILITTRNEDNVVLSRLGDPKVWKIGQIHEDHCFKRKYMRAFRRGTSGLDVLVLLTPGLVEEVRQWVPADAKTRLVTVPNFLEHFPAPFSLDEKEKRILAVGRLDYEKGFDRLLRCFARISPLRPDWTVRIVGDGEEQALLERLIAELGLEGKAVLTGRLPPSGVEEEMKKASVYAMTSTNEGVAFVLLEALSCALPIVAYDVRIGPAAVIRQGVDGYLVPDGDEDALVEKLLALMDDQTLRRTMAEAALRHAGEYSREKVAGLWEMVLEP